MEELKIFQNELFGTVRTIEVNNEPWFVAKDVCDILGYSDNEAMTRNLDEDEFQNRQIVGFGNRGTIIISESGFYTLVIRSNKPNAKDFRRWVTGEVIPQIRKTGGYIPISKEMTDKEIMRRALIIANNTIEEKDNIIEEQKRTKAHITQGREGTLFSKTGVLTQQVDRLQIELDRSKDYATIKRMSLIYHGIKFNWRSLKETSKLMNIESIDVYDANYESVKAYHRDVWKEVYALEF